MNENPSSEAVLNGNTIEIGGEEFESDGLDEAEVYRLRVQAEYYRLLHGEDHPTSSETVEAILGLNSPAKERFFVEFALNHSSELENI